MGSNKFVLYFSHKQDCALAMDGSPWLVERCTLLLTSLEDGVGPNIVEVNLMTIVVRVHRLPPHFRFGRVVEHIGSSLGVFVEWVATKNDELLDYVQVKVKIDVTDALKRGTYLWLGYGSRNRSRSLVKECRYTIIYVV